MAENWWRTLLDNILSNLIANLIIAATGATITGGVAVSLNLSPGYIFMLCVAGACVFIGVALLWQQYKTSRKVPPPITDPRLRPRLQDSYSRLAAAIESAERTKRFERLHQLVEIAKKHQEKPTLEIKFENVVGQRFCTWEMETENNKGVNVQRCSFLLENQSDYDVKNVSVKLERAIALGAREQALPSGYVGYTLQLDQEGTTIRSRDKVWVPFISYRKEVASGWISIEGVDQRQASKEGKLFSPYDGYELHVVVRADDGVIIPAQFMVRVENEMLTMTRLNPGTPIGPSQGVS